MMEDLLRLKKTLELAIQSLKYPLPMSHLLQEQQNELIEALLFVEIILLWADMLM